MSAAESAKVTQLPGTESKRPGPKPESSPADLRNPPTWLSAPAKKLWRALVGKYQAAYPGVLTGLDVPALALMLEHYVVATGGAEEMRGKGNVPSVLERDEAHRDRLRRSPSSQVMRDHSKAFLELAREYGLTVRSRGAIDFTGLGGFLADEDDDDAGLLDA